MSFATQGDRETRQNGANQRGANKSRRYPILSPLRYPGSKRRLAKFIAESLQRNHLQPGLFVEFFAGGASTALQLAYDGFVDSFGLVDSDPLVASFWKTVFFDADWLVNQVMTIDVTLDRWRKFKQSAGHTRREQAIACLFLNRTSFSGILAPGAGPIGGYQQTSKYKIDCRFTRGTLVKRIRQAEELRSKVAFVWGMHWMDALSLVDLMGLNGELPHDRFYYFDPPFFEKAERLYSYYFNGSDHVKLRDTVLHLGRPWVLSYDPAPQVEQLYGDVRCDPTNIELLYSAAKNAGNRVAQEVIITNLHVIPSNISLWHSSASEHPREQVPSAATG